ncbi:bZIP transcription factor [Tyrophagus putrescentiae]|nr:bZIP transcription factor [Tyrophagus putrescentiae]
MVDINNYSSTLDYCLSTFNSDPCDELSLEGIDCLENINENDFLNFDSSDGAVYSLQQYSSLLPETPPETPINYLNHNSNGSPQYAVFGDSPPRSASNSFTLPSPDSSGLSLMENGAYSPGSNSSSSSSSSSNSSISSSCHSSHQNLNFAITNSPPTAIIHSHPALIIPAPTISPPSIVIPSQLVNQCQPVLASIDLNGGTYQLATTTTTNGGGTSLVYSAQSIDRRSSSSTTIQPKPIQISPKQQQPAAPHKELLLSKNQTLEARKLRNREAALNSRMKKKEYVEGLEENVKSLTKERDDLREENRQLKAKVSELESRLSYHKRPPMDINGNYGAVSKRAKMSYFAVAVMLCLQVSPYLIPGGPDSDLATNTFPQSRQLQGPPAPALNQHTGRTLLWKRDTAAAANEDDETAAGASSLNSTSMYANMTKSVLCKDYLMNRTESMRLESELRDWFTRFQLEEKQQLLMYRQQLRRHRLNKLDKVLSSGTAAAGTSKEGLAKTKKTGVAGATNKRLLFDSKYVPIPRLKLWMQRQNGDYDDLSEQFEGGPNDSGAGDGGTKEERSGASVESLFGLDYQSLLATIHRRDDTFYYLSYPSKGHLILPPISNRSDVRPRFSFLIPTFHNLSLDDNNNRQHRNNSPSAHPNAVNSTDGGAGGHPPQMFILQIDCQVINTKVTLINDDRFGNANNKTAAAASAVPTKLTSRKGHRERPQPAATTTATTLVRW